MSTEPMRTVWKYALPVIIINALIQPLLIMSDPTPALTWSIWPLAAISLLSLTVTTIVIVSAVCLRTTGKYSYKDLISRLRSRLLPVLLYTVGWLVLMILGLSLWVIPGLILLAVTPYLLIAVIEGSGNPIASNFHAIRVGLLRWILLLIASAFLVGMTWVASAFMAFFLPAFMGSALTWVAFGVIGTFVIQMWNRAWLRARSTLVPASR